jgi:hypothetical protein
MRQVNLSGSLIDVIEWREAHEAARLYGDEQA